MQPGVGKCNENQVKHRKRQVDALDTGARQEQGNAGNYRTEHGRPDQSIFVPDRKHHIAAFHPEKRLSDIAEITEIDEGGGRSYREPRPMDDLPHE
jgi:hypothetical protein